MRGCLIQESFHLALSWGLSNGDTGLGDCEFMEFFSCMTANRSLNTHVGKSENTAREMGTGSSPIIMVDLVCLFDYTVDVLVAS